MPITILIADDHQLLREGLQVLLDNEDGLEVVGTAGDGREALKLARRLQPDIVIMDIGMPDMNGVTATQRILADYPHVRVLALSAHADEASVRKMLDAGAYGYLLKNCAHEEVVRAIMALSNKQRYLSPAVTETVLDAYRDRDAFGAAGQGARLSSREREVLQLVAEGKTSNQIAQTLFLSVKTIESHRKHIMEKLGLRTVAELTKYAVRAGLTHL